ncbi:EamA-like transporter family protein [Rubripirellula obstinata]|uniref:EamA-like transporter family protein n=1 Tax=Rubripirellula obstinata TaxID=406547 RepID=A0A5B1CPU4_9BACT|nr:DMT family transporter [Rubripirellula obstinata]KAA1261879.1 EamA-like transporter family protein [Rubripirellula obstinata]
MSWLLLSVLSAFLLGIYDAAKKASVRENAVPPVLFFAVVCGAAIWVPLLVFGKAFPDWLPTDRLRVQSISTSMHAALFLKSVIVGTSWTLAYFSLKRLPLSIAGPLRAIGPVWTILLATMLLGERPTLWQWIGIVVVLVAFYAFSVAGKKEGIQFRKDPAVAWMVIATIVGACSGLYDKILLQNFALDAATVQAWFSIYLVVVLFPLVAYWYCIDSAKIRFTWRASIPLIAICLLAADFAYFTALTDPDALVSVVSPIRRLATVISFAIGIVYFGEKNVRRKAACVAVLISGVFLISLG